MNKSLSIGIVGYGKMGKMVESIAIERGHSIGFSAGSGDMWSEADVIIEFTRSEAVLRNIEKALGKNLPIVTGTTGWHNHLDEVTESVRKLKGSLLHASNFSLGVNLFFELNGRLAEMMAKHTEYKPKIEETHHTQKLDSPSGTAIRMADQVLNQHSGYDRWMNDYPADPNTLPIVSKREPDVPGTHIITWENDIDIIELKHTAKNRRGFALGAVIAAEWLVGRSGVFTMSDVIKE